jgi:hypothetical protein
LTLRVVPALLPVAMLVRLSSVPVVIDEVVSVRAVCVESVPHFQVCAQFALSIEFVVVAAVKPESAVLPPPLIAVHELPLQYWSAAPVHCTMPAVPLAHAAMAEPN